jgi:molybdopterin/thiamine biosynthesis adenylyltransferase
MSSTSNSRLARSRALVVGVGGLGSTAALALARAGVGTLGLVDPDTVEASNLHRQPLYDTADIGRPKVGAAAARLLGSHPGLRVEGLAERLGAAHAALVARFDVVLDGTDSIAAKFVVNDLCVAAGVPLVHAGVIGFRAQITTVRSGGACYRCVFEEAPPPGDVASCQEAGVLGPVAVLAGALQAAEALRLLRGEASHWASRLLVLDLLAGRHRTVPLASNPSCPACAAAPAARRSEAS